MKPTIYVDVTRTIQSQLHTGIQRVVRQLHRSLTAVGGDDLVHVRAVSCTAGRWHTLHPLPPHPLEPFESEAEGVLTPTCFQKGDLLLMADAAWYWDPWPAVDSALSQGTRLVTFVHDILPHKCPQWFRSELPPRFRRHLSDAVPRSSLILVPSQHVAGQLLQSKWLNTGTQPFIQVLPLGADALTSPDVPGSEVSSLIGLQQQPHVLCVGTLEPRKNQALLLDALDPLWAVNGNNNVSFSLILVGQAGWNVPELQHRIESHPEYGRQMHWLRNVTDASLAKLHQTAHAALFPSFDEGFGLPLAEAIYAGTPVIAADTPIFREVGGQAPLYLPPHQPEAWRQAICALKPRNPANPLPVTHAPQPTLTWGEVAFRLVQILRDRGLLMPLYTGRNVYV